MNDLVSSADAALSACRQAFGSNWSLLSPGDRATNIEVTEKAMC
jgi:hypothetical protein